MKRRHLPAALTAMAPLQTRPMDASLVRWVQSNPVIRFAPEADYGPFVFRAADGRVTGLSIDLLDLIVAQTGLGLSRLPPQPLAPILEGLKRDEIDFASSLRPTPERAAFLLFTRPYIDVPAVLVVPAASERASWDALSGQSVAVGAGYAVEGHVRQRHPALAWAAVPSDVEALAGVAAGRHAGAVLDVASLAFLSQAPGVAPLKVADAVGFRYSLSFAVRKTLPGLLDVLDAGLLAIPAAQRQAVVDKWLGPYTDRLEAPAYSPAIRAGLACLLAAGGLAGVLGVQRLRRERGRLRDKPLP